jgi:uncharacterized protein YcfL
MLGKLMNAALSAGVSLAAIAMVGCSAQSQSAENNGVGMNASGSQMATVSNQGRFPASAYAQEQEPSYALTGQEQSNWIPNDRTINAGNARVTLPATR